MSFKTKRWAKWRDVNMADLIPGWKGYRTPGAGGITTGGWAVPFGGKIVVMGYAADDSPIYAFYDPVSNTVTGSGSVPSGQRWYGYNATHGNSSCFVVWKDKYLLIVPQWRGYYYYRGWFAGFDSGLAFHDPPFKLPGDRLAYGGGFGSIGGEPCCAAYHIDEEYGARIVLHSIHGAAGGVWAGPFYIHRTSGSPSWYTMRYIEGYWVWHGPDGDALYGSPPSYESGGTGYIALGSFGANWTGLNGATRGYTPDPSGGGVWMWTQVDGEVGFWAQAGAPLTPADRPWGGYTWDYRRMQDGGFTTSDHDLDGMHHGVAFPAGPGSDPITKVSNGWYAGVGSTDGNVRFTVYALDPRQPSRYSKTRRAASATACFVGEYAIGDDLKLAHVLPLPDDRDPSAAALPPQDRQDGYIIGSRELFKRQGNSIRYVRDMKLKFEGYSFGPDWWFPGENPDHTLDTTLGFFAGAQTVMGRYPDYMWGRLNPLGGDVSRGIGIPRENLRAKEPDPIYVVKNNQVVGGSLSWVTPGATGYAILRGSLTDPRLCYHEAFANIGSKPKWNARAGLIVGNTWQTLVDFEEIDMPELGNDGWTVMGLCPIPVCRSLPRGGWLVNAELYFAPWDVWERKPGARDLTFRNTGNGWVPAKPGYIGPLPIEDWSPKLLTAYDEWTKGRSDYGPAALMVFDYDGEFVECLNSTAMYPPYAGSEIAVLPGTVPRILYRVKGGGTYSDCAEGWGCYQNNSGEADFQAPLFAVYELERNGRIQVGAGAFCGFVDMNEMAKYELKAEGWRWSAVGAAVDWQYPKSIWAPYSRVKVREGIGGSGVTLLGGNGSGRAGVRGPGARAN